MILLDRKKPISALKLVHTFNHTQTNRFCDIHDEHINLIPTLNYDIEQPIYNLNAGLYKIIFNGNEYVIDIHYKLSDNDYLYIKNENNITIYMAGSTPYPVTPYRINSTKNITSTCFIESVNDSIDIIMVAGATNHNGSPSLDKPTDISRINSIIIDTYINSDSSTLKIPLKYSIGSLINGAIDYVVINTDKMIAHYVINTAKEMLSAGLNWQYKEECSNQQYYVFYCNKSNVKRNDLFGSIFCTRFESVVLNELIDENTNKNCIAVSDNFHDNGIWIKIDKTILDIHGDKNYAKEFSKWLLNINTGDNPIYIEYELSNTTYDTFLIDEYHIKSWYPLTTITIEGNYGFSIFYKALKNN